jgi:hypothetical protein
LEKGNKKYTVSFKRVNILLKINNHQKIDLGQSEGAQKHYLEHSSSIIERDNRDQVTQQS